MFIAKPDNDLISASLPLFIFNSFPNLHSHCQAVSFTCTQVVSHLRGQRIIFPIDKAIHPVLPDVKNKDFPLRRNLIFSSACRRPILIPSHRIRYEIKNISVSFRRISRRLIDIHGAAIGYRETQRNPRLDGQRKLCLIFLGKTIHIGIRYIGLTQNGRSDQIGQCHTCKKHRIQNLTQNNHTPKKITGQYFGGATETFKIPSLPLG